MHIPVEIPENTLWIEFRNGKGDIRKGYAAKSLKESPPINKGWVYSLVFKEVGDMDYRDDYIVVDVFDSIKRVSTLLFRSWAEVVSFFEFRPQKHVY